MQEYVRPLTTGCRPLSLNKLESNNDDDDNNNNNNNSNNNNEKKV